MVDSFTNLCFIVSTSRSRVEAERRQLVHDSEVGTAAAAVGFSLDIQHGRGVKQRQKRHVDSQDKLDELLSGLHSSSVNLGSVMREVASSTAESPKKKTQREINSLSTTILQLMEEAKLAKELGWPTDDIRTQLRKLQDKRNTLFDK